MAGEAQRAQLVKNTPRSTPILLYWNVFNRHMCLIGFCLKSNILLQYNIVGVYEKMSVFVVEFRAHLNVNWVFA